MIECVWLESMLCLIVKYMMFYGSKSNIFVSELRFIVVLILLVFFCLLFGKVDGMIMLFYYGLIDMDFVFI